MPQQTQPEYTADVARKETEAYNTRHKAQHMLVVMEKIRAAVAKGGYSAELSREEYQHCARALKAMGYLPHKWRSFELLTVSWAEAK